MTQEQNHRRPLAPGEIRAHQVGAEVFRVMHVMNGGMVQASVSGNGMATRVLTTALFESDAVRAYADAIEQAESDAIDADEDYAAPSFIASASGELVTPGAEPTGLADRAATVSAVAALLAGRDSGVSSAIGVAIMDLLRGKS